MESDAIPADTLLSAEPAYAQLLRNGPYIGNRDDQFAVKFEMDVTPKDGERMQMTEIALYTVRDGRIAEERFLYHS